MTNRFFNPNPQFASATDVYAGGSLSFSITGTSTPTDTYSDSILATPNANPITLDAAGRSPTDIFLDPNTTYKVVLKDSAGATVWTKDPVVDPAANVTAAFAVYPGDPNGNVAGNEGTLGGSGASVIWDITNNLLYVCTTTGNAATAVWGQVAASITGSLALTSIISPTSLGADQNDYAPTGFSSAFYVRQDSSVAVAITGLAGGGAGRLFEYTNISAFNHTFRDESTASAAANRFDLPADLVIVPGYSRLFWYDSISSRWRPVGDHYNAPTGDPGGRLTLTTAIPVLTSDVTAATTVFYTPYKHNYIRLYNGASWQVVQFSELSQTLADATKSPAAGAVSSLYDMFVWNDAGTLRCTRGPAWSTAITRGTGAGTTELEQVDGTWVNKIAITNGPAARRGAYVGTIATSASGANGQLNMMFFPAAAAGGSGNRLDVWNMYNRVSVASTCRDSTDSWNYTTATWRSANNSTANRITAVCGLNEDAVLATGNMFATNSSTNVAIKSALGLDSTSAITGLTGSVQGDSLVIPGQMISLYAGLLGLGSHFVQLLEFSAATGTTTYYGDNATPLNLQSGLQLNWRM
jgi:hypothetical protein